MATQASAMRAAELNGLTVAGVWKGGTTDALKLYV